MKLSREKLRRLIMEELESGPEMNSKFSNREDLAQQTLDLFREFDRHTNQMSSDDALKKSFTYHVMMILGEIYRALDTDDVNPVRVKKIGHTIMHHGQKMKAQDSLK